MPKSDEYRATLKGPGVLLERSVTEEVAKRIVLLLVGASEFPPHEGGGSGGVRAPRPVVTGPPPSKRTELSLREFLLQSEAKRNPEKLAAIAEYLRLYRNQDEFKRTDYAQAFDEARERTPGNINRDITWAVRIGWLTPKSGEPDTFKLTGSGTKAVEQKFPEELRKKTKVSKGGRRKKRTA